MYFMNDGLLTDVHKSETFLYGQCNSGTMSINLKGEYSSIDCWLNDEGIAKKISTPVIKKLGFCITYDIMDNDWWASKENITVKFK